MRWMLVGLGLALLSVACATTPGDPGASSLVLAAASRVGTGTDWTQVSAGSSSTCAIKKDHTLWCWGFNHSGQLGDGSTQTRRTPTQVGTDSNWVQVSVNSETACGVREEGTLWCWGNDSLSHEDHLGYPHSGPHPTPWQVGFDSNWKSVTVGQSGNRNCALRTSGTLWCWGFNIIFDGLPPGTYPSWYSEPTEVSPGSNWQSISIATTHSCGIRASGEVWCWGINGTGQLGTGDNFPRLISTRMGNESDWSVIAAANRDNDQPEGRTCALKTNHSLWCWGTNIFTTPSTGGSADQFHTSAVPTLPGRQFHTLASGRQSSCATGVDGTLWCWGAADYPAGLTQIRTAGTPDAQETDWESVSVGSEHTCAIQQTGALWCWGGQNHWGEWGVG